MGPTGYFPNPITKRGSPENLNGGEGRMHIYDVTKKLQYACISEKAPQRHIQTAG